MAGVHPVARVRKLDVSRERNRGGGRTPADLDRRGEVRRTVHDEGRDVDLVDEGTVVVMEHMPLQSDYRVHRGRLAVTTGPVDEVGRDWLEVGREEQLLLVGEPTCAVGPQGAHQVVEQLLRQPV